MGKSSVVRNKSSRLAKAALAVCLSASILAGLIVSALLGAGWWIDFSEQPVKSDILVVLGGNASRPLYAADLYAQGDAPEIWIGRPRADSDDAELDKLGIRMPDEGSLDREILARKGVPEDRVHFYGRDLNSTVDEALALSREFPSRGKKILIVTSRYHARRAGFVFRHFLPEADIRMVATPYESFDRKWWRNKDLAESTILEMAKTLYYFLGGRTK